MTPTDLDLATDIVPDGRRPYAPPALADLGLVHEITQEGEFSDSGVIVIPGGGTCPYCC